MSEKWDRRFIDLALHISGWSKDPSTKVGCVVVGEDREIRSTGFNGFPRGIDDSMERLEDRELKYPLICHAEENAIMHAARIGISLKDCTAYVTWPPCTRCARSLIQAGVVEVVYPGDIEIPDRWIEDFERSNSMMKEAGVITRSTTHSD
jgi:dCMP deaminase